MEVRYITLYGRARLCKKTTCPVCGTVFWRRTDKKSKSGLHFCCVECKNTAQSIGSGFDEIIPSHYGNIKGRNTYRMVAFNHYPHKCEYCGYSECVGILEVHHLDHDRDNNSEENLAILCPNCHRKDTVGIGYYKRVKDKLVFMQKECS